MSPQTCRVSRTYKFGIVEPVGYDMPVCHDAAFRWFAVR